MEFRAVVEHKGALAHYAVKNEDNNLYEAFLLRYNGKQEEAPVAGLYLIKVLGRWTGSISDHHLLDGLGRAIEEHLEVLLYENVN